MILEGATIGIDLAHERAFIGLLQNRRALERTFTAHELQDCLSRNEDTAHALARRFAAKEALIKACGHGIGYLNQIEIVHGETGRPLAHWKFLEQQALDATISMSSAGHFAVAAALVGSRYRPHD